jgi:hypothetical protein
MRKTTVGFVDGLSRADDTWPPLTVRVGSDDVDLGDFFTVNHQEYTEFGWDGPADEFPHNLVRFEGQQSGDALMLSFVLDHGVELPGIANTYGKTQGLPLSTEGWIERLAFGPGGVIYFGVLANDGMVVTVPIYLGQCENWSDDDFTNIHCQSWKKYIDENAMDRFSEIDDGEETDSDFEDEVGPWVWEFELAGGGALVFRWPGENPEVQNQRINRP